MPRTYDLLAPWGASHLTAKGERIFGWDSHRDPAGKTWKLHGMLSLGKRNFPFAITHRRRKPFTVPLLVLSAFKFRMIQKL